MSSADSQRPADAPPAAPDAAPATSAGAPGTASAAPAAKGNGNGNGNGNRRKALFGVAGVVALVGIAYAIYWALVLNHYESTDNAYVQGNVVQLTPQVGGTVTAIAADDTDFVKAGQVIVKLDPADAQVALDQAEAQLAQTVREVRTLFGNNGTLKAQIALLARPSTWPVRAATCCAPKTMFRGVHRSSPRARSARKSSATRRRSWRLPRRASRRPSRAPRRRAISSPRTSR